MGLNNFREPYIIFSGGMPRPSYADRHTVSVVQGANQVVFDFTSRVIDFVVLSNSDILEDPTRPGQVPFVLAFCIEYNVVTV